MPQPLTFEDWQQLNTIVAREGHTKWTEPYGHNPKLGQTDTHSHGNFEWQPGTKKFDLNDWRSRR
jgi:hypothetical protein